MMDLPTYSGKQFSWQDQLGITEASTLGIPAGAAAPVALRVRSHRTGKVLNFLYVGDKTRGDDRTVHVYVAGSGIAIHVYND